MMATLLAAPRLMKGRGQVIDMLASLSQPVPGSRVEVIFPDNSRPTTSFISQMIDTVAVDWGCKLVFRGLPEWAGDTAHYLAEYSNVEIEVADKQI